MKSTDVCVARRAIVLLSLLTLCRAFTPPAQCRSLPALRMGYLDDLNPKQPPPENKKPDVTPKQSSGGLVPSGRGPLGSYLDNVSSGASAEEAEDDSDWDDHIDDSTAEEATKKPASWSGVYLSNFLTGPDDARTDIRNLLTQRSIQSFMFLCEECRDPHSAKWIQEDFLNTRNLLQYHGTGAGFIERFGGTWDAPLLDLISKPKDRIVVSAKRRGRGHGGWSKNNPYLKERWMELNVDIDPANLATRIVSVREQIAGEWVNDLDIVVEANDLILDSYFSKIRAGGQTDVAFERTAVNHMNDSSRFSNTVSSPFRRSNFDLLYNLCTQAAIHRILRDKKEAGEERTMSFVFLRDFYTARAEEYFDGDQPYGRADDFIDELLQTSPSLLSTDDGISGLADPIGAAEEIVKMRKEVTGDWKALMIRVPEDHTGIRQALLSKQMQRSMPDEETDSAAFQ